MQTGAFTGYIDVAQILLYIFWIFFAGLIFYLRREDKREGYPLESDQSDRDQRILIQGFPAMPEPKTFLLPHGGSVQVPRDNGDRRKLAIEPTSRYPGSPYRPTGDGMGDGVGPASWAERAETPDLTIDGAPKIVPLRVATDYLVDRRDPDPRGMSVYGADGVSGGTVREIWVDRSEPQVRYLEVTVSGGRHVLLPIYMAKVDRRLGKVQVNSIMGSQFAGVPAHANPDQVTLAEEDRISAYYAGGLLYAEPSRAEPLL